MSIIFFHGLIFISIIYLNGLFFIKNILYLQNDRNFYEVSLIGLIVTIVLAQLLNFIIPLNDFTIIGNLIFSLFYLIFSHRKIIQYFKIKLDIFTLSLLLSFANIYGSGFADDINHYHYGFIANIDTSNLIWGQSFLHPVYGMSSSWLFGHSFFNFDHFRLQDIHILNGIILFLIIGLFFTELMKKKLKISFTDLIIFPLTLFILFKYTRLKEFGIDRPSLLLFCFLTFYYAKYFLNENQNNILKNFLVLALISIFIFSIKLIYLPVLIFPLYIFLKNKKKLFQLDINYLIIIIPLLIIFLKNILGSGCIFFPAEYTCVNIIPWSNIEGAKELSLSAEIVNKSWSSYTGDLGKNDYIKNFNWFNTWFERGNIEIRELLLTLLIVTIFTFISFNLQFKKMEMIKGNLKDIKIILSIIIILSISIFLIKNPVIRMNHYILVSLMILIIIFFSKFKFRLYNKSPVVMFMIIGLIFNLYKNYNRISDNNFLNNPKLMVLEKIDKPKKKNVNNFVYYQGWYGKNPVGNQNLDNRKHKKILIFDILY